MILVWCLVFSLLLVDVVVFGCIFWVGFITWLWLCMPLRLGLICCVVVAYSSLEVRSFASVGLVGLLFVGCLVSCGFLL